ncbi:flagellar basal body P-ring formation chaperone FlgA [Methylobacter sp. S3L5C]|uniref:flagellar basal body P-ring formation chaperone FlgA n=1 Tax=Methylobacter sp. S3L5C TaxID=2839024 RepID=UPI001FAE4E5A|nr:flagellar basal body P-ring formation chaperone FlgA [Methylobacter sp. S3L5C]UOA08764.1 flagellar basal body P-ring formation protein FlgA [Methylobacter sp. S3L5C]
MVTKILFFKNTLGVLLTVLLSIQLAWAQADPQLQNHEELRGRAIQFLTTLPGVTHESKIKVTLPDSQLSLVNCESLEFFLPTGSSQHGNMRLGARCTAPQAWSLYLIASILQPVTHFITLRAMEKGQAVNLNDVTANSVYEQHPPNGLINDPQELAGRTLIRPLPAGASLRSNDLHTEPTLTRGQTVKIIATGKGFGITYEGKSLANAMAGEAVQVRTQSNHIISGIARTGGIVEIVGN